MLQFYFWKLGLFVLFLSLVKVSAKIDISLHYCRLKCDNQCEDEVNEAIGNKTERKDYYWRNYYGIIPPDAYPLGKPDQFPQTYIGLVYDSENEGVYPTTIIEGLDYAYTVLNGSVNKKTGYMQILCTKEPEKLILMELNADNYKSIFQTYKVVSGSYHRRSQERAVKHFIVISSTCHVNYATYSSQITGTIEYVLMDGSVMTTNTYKWLLYDSRPKVSNQKAQSSFFKHYYKYSIRPGKIIPLFYKQIVIGSCSLICTNEYQDGTKDPSKAKMLKYSMRYYWKPISLLGKNEGFALGSNSMDGTVFVGQSYIVSPYNQYDLGTANFEERTVAIPIGRSRVLEYVDAHVLSSDQTKYFTWVTTTSDTFKTLDMSKLIQGGELSNATKTFVGRTIPNPAVYTGSVRMFGQGAALDDSFVRNNQFQVLMSKD